MVMQETQSNVITYVEVCGESSQRRVALFHYKSTVAKGIVNSRNWAGMDPKSSLSLRTGHQHMCPFRSECLWVLRAFGLDDSSDDTFFGHKTKVGPQMQQGLGLLFL